MKNTKLFIFAGHLFFIEEEYKVSDLIEFDNMNIFNFRVAMLQLIFLSINWKMMLE
ncbi:hypothetical protein AWH56_011760 [Anaerobacillus isosaccharinicus]|uniref:Uncharacterized protein n=1 Tax=Anaerobacillus isosaccharinicus TaxID=1532552 RepID=A0A7S7LBU4_9BACI|nr:hypothetical protein [Anaerobacillus isosaccharinicus]MBA5588426.1 hypothetical protein [Anaerobacillus isosaccharinicus]QOY38146.1 hypothetical protein AWH56_011760 [Anaerobacillus isosaccharinicus]